MTSIYSFTLFLSGFRSKVIRIKKNINIYFDALSIRNFFVNSYLESVENDVSFIFVNFLYYLVLHIHLRTCCYDNKYAKR